MGSEMCIRDSIYSAPLGLKSGEIQGYSHFVSKPKELVLGFPAVYVRREGEVVVPLWSTRLPASCLIWPGVRSFTRQPATEIHTWASPVLLHEIVGQ
mgnify:CR=1 FL=1